MGTKTFYNKIVGGESTVFDVLWYGCNRKLRNF